MLTNVQFQFLFFMKSNCGQPVAENSFQHCSAQNAECVYRELLIMISSCVPGTLVFDSTSFPSSQACKENNCRNMRSIFFCPAFSVCEGTCSLLVCNGWSSRTRFQASEVLRKMCCRWNRAKRISTALQRAVQLLVCKYFQCSEEQLPCLQSGLIVHFLYFGIRTPYLY